MTDPVISAVENVATTSATSFLSGIGIYIAIGLIAVALGLGWYAHGVWYKAEEESTLQAEIDKRVAAEDKYNKKDQDYQKLKLLSDAKDKLLTTETTNEVTKPIYHSCTLPDAAKLLIRQAVSPTTTTR